MLRQEVLGITEISRSRIALCRLVVDRRRGNAHRVLPRLSVASGAGSCGCRGISNLRKVRFADVRRMITCVRRSKIVVDLCGPSTRSNSSAASQRTRSRIRGWDDRVTS